MNTKVLHRGTCDPRSGTQDPREQEVVGSGAFGLRRGVADFYPNSGFVPESDLSHYWLEDLDLVEIGLAANAEKAPFPLVFSLIVTNLAVSAIIHDARPSFVSPDVGPPRTAALRVAHGPPISAPPMVRSTIVGPAR